MKLTCYNSILFIFFITIFSISSCSKKSTPEPVTTTTTHYGGIIIVTDTIITVKLDTIWNAAGDSLSRSFVSEADGQAYTSSQVTASNLSSQIMYGYYYHTDSTIVGGSIANAHVYPVTYKGWTGDTTMFRVTTMDTTAYNNAVSRAQLKNAFTAATSSSKQAIYVLQPGQIIAFKTQDNKYGLLRVLKLNTPSYSPGTYPQPYQTYMVYEAKFQK